MENCGCITIKGNFPSSAQTVNAHFGVLQGHFYKVLESIGFVEDLSPPKIFARNLLQVRDPNRGTTLHRFRKYLGITLSRLGAAACISLLSDRFLHYVDPAHYTLIKNKMGASDLFRFCMGKTEEGYEFSLGSKVCASNASFNLEISFFGLLLTASVATYLFGKILTPMKFDSQMDAAHRGLQFLAKELETESSPKEQASKQLLLVGHWALVLEAMNTRNKEFIGMMKSNPMYKTVPSEVIEEHIYQLGERMFNKLFQVTKNELYKDLSALYSSKAPCRA